MSDVTRHKSFWSTLVAFLKRDIRSFIKQPDQASLFQKHPPPPDPSKLVQFRYRREILDWRDETIIQLSAIGMGALNDFSLHVQGLLKEVSIWRLLWSKPANEVLREDFDNQVRLVILNEMRKAEQRLAKLLIRQVGNNQKHPSVIDYGPDSQLDCIVKLNFKPTSQDDILSGLRSLVLTDQGIVPMFQNQVTNIADELIGKGL